MRNRANSERSETKRPKNLLRELERAGEVISESRSYFGALPEIKLVRKTRLDRVVKVAKQ